MTPHRRARAIAVVAATAALAAYGALLFFVPAILDWAFDQGGKAPMLVAVIGAALVVGTFLGVEKLAS
ncbi:MAG: hypothetical protein AB7S26_04070 [Sandaracinaceae bacterium]